MKTVIRVIVVEGSDGWVDNTIDKSLRPGDTVWAKKPAENRLHVTLDPEVDLGRFTIETTLGRGDNSYVCRICDDGNQIGYGVGASAALAQQDAINDVRLLAARLRAFVWARDRAAPRTEAEPTYGVPSDGIKRQALEGYKARPDAQGPEFGE